MVLIVVVLMALVTTAFLTKSTTAFRASSVLQTKVRLQYGADAGLEKGLRAMSDDLAQASRTKCLTPFTPITQVATFTWTAAGFPVTVSCQDLQGYAADATASGIFGAAIIVTGGDHSFKTQSGVASPLDVGGTIYVSGLEDSGDVKKQVSQTAGDYAVLGCSGTPPDPGITTSPPYSKYCTSLMPSDVAPPVVLPAKPSAYLAPVTVPGLKGANDCQVFFPGYYNTANTPQLDLKNTDSYFASGVYYFNGSGAMTVNNKDTVVAGAKSPGDIDGQTSMGSAVKPCSDDVKAGALLGSTPSPISGSGAAFLMGGQSSLTISDGTAIFYSRPITVGLDIPLSLYTLRSGDTGWTAWTGAGDVLKANNPLANMLLNGQINAYDAGVNIFATNNTYAAARAGIIGRTVTLQASAKGTNLDVSGYGTSSTVGSRIVRLTVSAVGTASDAGRANGTSVVRIPNDTTVKPTVLSWSFS